MSVDYFFQCVAYFTTQEKAQLEFLKVNVNSRFIVTLYSIYTAHVTRYERKKEIKQMKVWKGEKKKKKADKKK